jgi:hypothetical protein
VFQWCIGPKQSGGIGGRGSNPRSPSSTKIAGNGVPNYRLRILIATPTSFGPRATALGQGLARGPTEDSDCANSAGWGPGWRVVATPHPAELAQSDSSPGLQAKPWPKASARGPTDVGFAIKNMSRVVKVMKPAGPQPSRGRSTSGRRNGSHLDAYPAKALPPGTSKNKAKATAIQHGSLSPSPVFRRSEWEGFSGVGLDTWPTGYHSGDSG